LLWQGKTHEIFAYLVNSDGADDGMGESGDRSVAPFSAGGGERR